MIQRDQIRKIKGMLDTSIWIQCYLATFGPCWHNAFGFSAFLINFLLVVIFIARFFTAVAVVFVCLFVLVSPNQKTTAFRWRNRKSLNRNLWSSFRGQSWPVCWSCDDKTKIKKSAAKGNLLLENILNILANLRTTCAIETVNNGSNFSCPSWRYKTVLLR